MMVAVLVLPPTIVGMIEVSITRKPSTPGLFKQYVTTLSSGSLLNLGCDNIGLSPHFAVSLHGSYEVVLHGKEGRRGPRGDRNLVVDVLDMVVGGLLGDG